MMVSCNKNIYWRNLRIICICHNSGICYVVYYTRYTHSIWRITNQILKYYRKYRNIPVNITTRVSYYFRRPLFNISIDTTFPFKIFFQNIFKNLLNIGTDILYRNRQLFGNNIFYVNTRDNVCQKP